MQIMCVCFRGKYSANTGYYSIMNAVFNLSESFDFRRAYNRTQHNPQSTPV